MHLRTLTLLAALHLTLQPGAVAERGRLNLWPIVYVNEEGFSALGPIVKIAEDNVAFRPFFAVNTEHHTRIRVLYPLSEFNIGQKGPQWLFPFFWGEDYRVAFPFYWRFDHPYRKDGRGYHGLIPLYSYRRDKEHYSLRAPWPLVRFSDWRGESEQRLWPLYGRKESSTHFHQYILWPLSARWQDKKVQRDGSYAFPLYFRKATEHTRSFVSIPWSSGRDERTDKQHRAVFPFFFWQHSPDGATLATLPWIHSRTLDETRWFCPPLLSWGSTNTDAASWKSLLGLVGHRTDADDRRSYALPLFYTARNAERDLFLSLPYSRRSSEIDAETWTALPPFYFGSESPRRTLRATPLGGWQRYADGRLRWDVYPLLTWLDRDGEDYRFWALAPLFNQTREGGQRKHHLLPFYAYSELDQRFLSLPYLQWKEGNRRSTVIPPLLSRYDRGEQERQLWSAAGLFRQQWGIPREQRKGHFIPFYYYESTNLFLSPVYGRRSGGTDAASYYATPLVGRYTGDYRGTWIWPLYRNKTHRDTGHYDDYNTLFLGRRWKSENTRGSRLFPIYSHRHTAWNRPADHASAEPMGIKAFPAQSHESTVFNLLLLGRYERSEREWTQNERLVSQRTRQHRLFPLWSHRRTENPHAESAHSRTALLLGLYNTRASERGGKESVRRRLLWKLWDYQRTNEEVQVDAFPFITYDRAESGAKETRFLWRFFRYGRDEAGGRSLDLCFIPLMRP